MEMKKIIFENVTDFYPEHIFECGQCFRWIPAGDGSGDYIGAASSYAARLSWRDGVKKPAAAPKADSFEKFDREQRAVDENNFITLQ
jgi:hypothetical protein